MHGLDLGRVEGLRKGTNTVSTNGVTANIMFFIWQRDFLGIPVNLLLSSQKLPGRSLYPDLSKLITFAAAP